MENVKNRQDIELRSTKARKQYLVLEPNYPTTKKFFKKVVSHRNGKKKQKINKTQIFMNTLVYLGL